ncbi:hypothetical protein E1B28_011351 [Marasmius oreades]|uniref:DUF1776-domain-containing protein n=1 Tax=Marasmius oreades TaxID=181124 RepID=A0A9P7RTW4_9AGAR|nr:uncharacterized protein E1B28_011351 [Marasmius oreades]KAG7089696.1 hypothetical protein E1B28_011351 [Marasmius oreades]
MNMDKIEEYLESLEELIYSSLDAASPGYIRETINQLWIDITRYGPSLPNMPEIRLPGLGDFEVPPPPPPPPPSSLYERSCTWAEKHPWKAGGIALGAVGTGLLVGYGGVYMKAVKARKALKSSSSTERRQVVVVLGGDTPLGHPLVLDLERKGYIVIASVTNQEMADALERKCRGYVRALVLDPSEPETIPLFLRTLSSALSRRFPITSAGDPFASPASHPYIHSVVSLLTLSPPFTHAPLEHVSFQDAYLPYLTHTQVTPLQVIQSLLPLLRHVPSAGKKSIVVCLPATETRFGLPFSSIQSMSAAGTMRAVEVLRREISVAAMTGKSETMKNIRVVAIEVGAFNVGNERPQHFTPLEAMEKWTASEKITYGPAFAAIIDSARYGREHSVHRRPTDVKVLVNGVVAIVSNGQLGGSSASFLSWFIRPRWVCGERFSVGAGARTYRLASYLPTILLDALLNIPHFLISIRNALLPSQPFLVPRPAMKPRAETITTGLRRRVDEESGSSNGIEHSENGSEADVESNSGDGSGVESSWVSLKEEKERST